MSVGNLERRPVSLRPAPCPTLPHAAPCRTLPPAAPTPTPAPVCLCACVVSPPSCQGRVCARVFECLCVCVCVRVCACACVRVWSHLPLVKVVCARVFERLCVCVCVCVYVRVCGLTSLSSKSYGTTGSRSQPSRSAS